MNSMPTASSADLISTKLDVRLGGSPSNASYLFIVRPLTPDFWANCSIDQEKVMKSQSLTRKCCPRARFFSGSEARITTSADDALVMRRLWHEQDIQCLGFTTGNPPRTRAHVAKSSTVQTPRLRLIGRQHSRSGHRQQQSAENFTAFMTAIQRFMKACAILWRKLHARFSEHAFDQANRVLVSRRATLDILERISMKTGRLSQVPNRPIQRSMRNPDLCNCANVTCDKVAAMITMSPNQRGIQ